MLSEALLPHMLPGKSSIIHMSSIRARQSEPNNEVHVQQQQASARGKHFTKDCHGIQVCLLQSPSGCAVCRHTALQKQGW